MANRMKIGSLFSGAGGLDMAVEQVFGGTLAWHCEVDPAASKVLAHRWPGMPNYGDITTIQDWEWRLAQETNPVDVLCGGWPCQPFSLAGKRKGAEDERALWPEVARAVRMVRPRYVVLENVSAVLGPEFQRVANDLAALGYDIAWRCLRASDVGAPHRRERLFAIATDTDRGRFQVGAQRDGDTAQPELEAPQRRDARGRGDDDAACRTEHGRLGGVGSGALDLLPTPTRRDYKGGSATVSDGNGGRRPAELSDATKSRGDGGASDLASVACLLPTPNASDGSGGGQHPSRREGHSQQLIDEVLAPERWGKYAPAIARWEAVTRPAPSPTEPNKNGNPRLSAAFSEWLMGWPAGWVTDVPGISRNDALRIVGNGVCPQQAHAALTYLLSVALEVVA